MHWLDVNGQTSSLLTFLTYTTIHQKAEYARVIDEMVRSGIISGADDVDISLDEESNTTLDQEDGTSASESVPNILSRTMCPGIDILATAFILETIRLFPPVPLK